MPSAYLLQYVSRLWQLHLSCGLLYSGICRRGHVAGSHLTSSWFDGFHKEEGGATFGFSRYVSRSYSVLVPGRKDRFGGSFAISVSLE